VEFNNRKIQLEVSSRKMKENSGGSGGKRNFKEHGGGRGDRRRDEGSGGRGKQGFGGKKKSFGKSRF
jgi:hypothetical protein